MASPQILGMDLLTFLLTMASCMGLVVSSLTFLRTYTPTNLYLYAAESVAQTRIVYDTLEREDRFSPEQHRVSHLGGHLDSLEDDVKALIFIVTPPSSIFRRLGTWRSVWRLLYLSYGSDKLRVGLQTVYHQRKRLQRAIDRNQRHGNPVDFKDIEASAMATNELFGSLLGTTGSNVSTVDLEPDSPVKRSRNCATSSHSTYPNHPHATTTNYMTAPSTASNTLPLPPLPCTLKIPQNSFWPSRGTARLAHGHPLLPS